MRTLIWLAQQEVMTGGRPAAPLARTLTLRAPNSALTLERISAPRRRADAMAATSCSLKANFVPVVEGKRLLVLLSYALRG